MLARALYDPPRGFRHAHGTDQGDVDLGLLGEAGVVGGPSDSGGDFVQLAAGSTHACGLKTDGRIACWGGDSYGQATPPSGEFTQVACGHAFSCGLEPDGTVLCWGDEGGWGSGEGPAPVALPGPFREVAAGMYRCEEYGCTSGGRHVCALRTDGALDCWGENDNGQATPPSGTFTQVVVGGDYGCALGEEGRVECWGLIDLALEGGFVQITLGQEDLCGLTAEGSASCGSGTGAAQPPDGLLLRQMSCGSSCCGVTEDLTIACWGDVWR